MRVACGLLVPAALLALAVALVACETSGEEEGQLRRVIQTAVDDALRHHLDSLRCDNIRKRQAASPSLQSPSLQAATRQSPSLQSPSLQAVANEIGAQLKDTRDEIGAQLKVVQTVMQDKVAQMASMVRQQGQQCSCIPHLERLELAVQQQYDSLLESVVDVAEITIGTQQQVQQQLGNISAVVAEMAREAKRRPAQVDPDMRLALLTDSFYRFVNSSRRQLDRIASSQQRSAALLHVVADRARAPTPPPPPCGGPARDCADLHRQGFTASGVYVIRPELGRARLVSVVCDMATAGGGWTVLQRRADVAVHVDFFRDWDDYKLGFGNRSGEFWAGTELAHQLTRERPATLRLDMSDLDGERRYAEYAGFSVADESRQYRLTVGPYSGTAGDGLSRANGIGFTTRDRDNDQYGSGNCAELYKGGWWYDACHNGNPNGLYLRGEHGSYADGIDWRFWRGYHYSLATMEIKLRPVDFRPS